MCFHKTQTVCVYSLRKYVSHQLPAVRYALHKFPMLCFVPYHFIMASSSLLCSFHKKFKFLFVCLFVCYIYTSFTSVIYLPLSSITITKKYFYVKTSVGNILLNCGVAFVDYFVNVQYLFSTLGEF